MKEQCLVAEGIAYEEISKEGGILRADIRKKMISSVKQSQRFPKQMPQKTRSVRLMGKYVRKREVKW